MKDALDSCLFWRSYIFVCIVSRASIRVHCLHQNNICICRHSFRTSVAGYWMLELSCLSAEVRSQQKCSFIMNTFVGRETRRREFQNCVYARVRGMKYASRPTLKYVNSLWQISQHFDVRCFFHEENFFLCKYLVFGTINRSGRVGKSEFFI